MNARHFARQNLKRLPRKRAPKRLSVMPPPYGIERGYLRKLQPMLHTMHALVTNMFMPALTQVMRQVAAHRGDSPIDDYKNALDAVREKFGDIYSEDELTALAYSIATEVRQYATVSLGNTLDQQLDARPFIGVSPGVDMIIDSFVTSNVDLIQSISTRYFDEIQGLVADAIRSGRTTDDLAQDIEDRFDVSESRAEFIARDQVSKANGEITKSLQVDVGITQFIWRTSMDERVRPSHAALQGETFDWDDPPEVGIPGGDYNCRCTAEPILPDADDDSAQ